MLLHLKQKNIVGIRPGEKLHEEMITDTDSLNTIDIGKYYAILPSVSFIYSEDEYLKHYDAKKVPFGFKYNSRYKYKVGISGFSKGANLRTC